jgi:hypothetical protein
MLKRILGRQLLPALVVGVLVSSVASAQSLLYTRNGDNNYDRLGIDVHSAGDVNHDGHNDFIAGAPQDGYVFGLGNGFARVYSGFTGATLYTIPGANAGDAFGESIGSAGDVDHDNYADFVVGAPEFSTLQSLAGRVYVYSGKLGTVLWTFDGVNPGDELGSSVAGAGDVNNDGYPDIIAGAPLANGAGQTRGMARVYSGKTGAVLWTFNGLVDGARFGVSVDGVGDVNGDGYADVIVGSYNGAKVFSGANGSILYTITAPSSDDRIGFAVAGAGDVNGDNVPDFIVGAPQDGNVFIPGNGYAKIYSGANGSLLLTLNGTNVGDRFGCAVGGAKDINGDNHAELIVGADQFASGGNGYVEVFNGVGGALIHSFAGTAPNIHFGDSVDGLGDINADGKAEVILGAPDDNSAFTDSGQIQVWSTSGGSGCPVPNNYCVTTNNSTGGPSTISSSGTTSISANNFVLTVSGCPSNKLGLFLYGANQAQVPLGNGTRCVGNPFFRLPQVTTSQVGTASFALDYNHLPTGGQISAGSVENFQFWFRDPAAGGGFTNLSDGRHATFCP